MLDIYRSTKLLNSALGSEKKFSIFEKKKKMYRTKLVSGRMESPGEFL